MSTRPALHQAIYDNDLPRLTKLLSQPGIDVEVRDPGWCNTTPLLEAAYYNRPQMARLLLQHGADRCAADGSGNTPVMCAACGEADSGLATMEVLLEAGGGHLDLDVRDSIGWTAVMYAVLYNCPGCLRLLLARGASMAGRYGSGETVKELARRENQSEVLEVLEQEERNRGGSCVVGGVCL